MKIYINNQPIEIEEATNLATVINEHITKQYCGTMFGLAVAVNNNIIPKIKMEEYILVPNDKIMLIKAVCGG